MPPGAENIRGTILLLCLALWSTTTASATSFISSSQRILLSRHLSLVNILLSFHPSAEANVDVSSRTCYYVSQGKWSIRQNTFAMCSLEKKPEFTFGSGRINASLSTSENKQTNNEHSRQQKNGNKIMIESASLSLVVL